MIDNVHLIKETESLRTALTKLNNLSGADMTLIVVSDGDSLKVSGTLTDGDIRRALLAGHALDSAVKEAMHRNFRYLRSEVADNVDAIRKARESGITLLPMVDDEGRLCEVIDLNVTPTRLPLTAILMAGGKGERLKPLTDDTPKPLLQIGGKAIIDYNIEALVRVGITDIYVTTRHMAEKIHRHLETPVLGVKAKCVTETVQLGTIGSATLIDRSPNGNTLIMNSDLLTTISFEDMYRRHRNTHSSITVGVIPYQVSVPYAILGVDGDKVATIEEKPSYSYYANAGIYIFSNEILDSLQPGQAADAPDLIRSAIDAGKKVTYYVINGTWIDIGTPTDFQQATELMRHFQNLSSITS